jgi:hypothetical protein
MFYNVAITNSYVVADGSIGSDEGLLRNLIWKSCAIVISETPILAAIPDDETAISPSFVRVPIINLENCVLFTETNFNQQIVPENVNDNLELDEFLQRQHNMAFPVGEPWWKLLILNVRTGQGTLGFTASFIYSHSFGDGLSGVAFHMKFEEALAAQLPHLPSTFDLKVSSSSKALLPPQEALNAFPVSILFILKIMLNEYWPSKPNSALWTGSVRKMPLISRYRSIRISKGNTARLLALCKSHGATMTVFLQELVAKALFQILPEHYTTLRSVVAVSTRRWMDGAIKEDDMGLFVTAMPKMHRRPTISDELEIDWKQTLQSKINLQKFLTTKGKNILTGLLFLVKNWHKYLHDQIRKPRSLSFEISNLGVFPELAQARERDIKVSSREMLFSQTISVIDSAIQVSVVTGGDGCLAVGFSWQKDVVEERIIAHLSQAIESYLWATWE